MAEFGRRTRRTRRPAAAIATAFLASTVWVPAAHAAAPRSFAYIANGSGHTVSVLDTADDTVVATIPVGLHPQDVAAAPDGRYIYVNNGDQTVSKVDTLTDTVVATIPDGVIEAEGLAVSRDGRSVYLADFLDDKVVVIDTAAGRVAGTVDVGHGPYRVAFTPDGASAYVTDNLGGTVSIINTRTFAVRTVPFGRGTEPVGVAITPDGTRAYVTSRSTGSVSVVDTRTLAVTTPVTGIDDPGGVAISPDGATAYVTGGGYPGAVSVIDTRDDRITRTIAVDSVPDYPTFTPDGAKVYVSDSGNTDVSVINARTFAVTDVYGFTAPAGMAIAYAPSPSLTLTKTLIGNLVRGRDAAYALTVANAGNAPTDGSTITVRDSLPAPLKALAMAGAGWRCSVATMTCTRDDVVDAARSYAPITLTVGVPCDVRPRQRSVTNLATVVGGGSGTGTATSTAVVRGR